MRLTQIQSFVAHSGRLAALALATGALSLSPAHAGDVFKWTDSAGKIHYGDNPAGATQASKLEITPAPASAADQDATAPQAQRSSSNGIYSDTLRDCLASGGAMADCVNKASTAQTNQASNEREQAQRARTQYQINQQRLPINQPADDGATQTATNAAALAAERARRRREQQDRDWRYR